MSVNQDRLRDHEFDGIQEYDNRLPNWWLWTFYIMIIFAIGYWVHYHITRSGDLPHAEFVNEQNAATERIEAYMEDNPITDEMIATAAGDPNAVGAGKEVFDTYCVACHLADASGQIGPNLTDHYWIHGGTPGQIFNTITEGVPEKGMVSWKASLSAMQRQQVAAYIVSLRGKNRKGKAAEGKWEGPGPEPK